MFFSTGFQTRSRVQSNARYTVSKLNFVDLAGSERLGKTRVRLSFFPLCKSVFLQIGVLLRRWSCILTSTVFCVLSIITVKSSVLFEEIKKYLRYEFIKVFNAVFSLYPANNLLKNVQVIQDPFRKLLNTLFSFAHTHLSKSSEVKQLWYFLFFSLRERLSRRRCTSTSPWPS